MQSATFGPTPVNCSKTHAVVYLASLNKFKFSMVMSGYLLLSVNLHAV